jgi:hypothetical protein
MVQDLGFHQDPRFMVRGGAAVSTPQEQEIRRRVYWGCFIADKRVTSLKAMHSSSNTPLGLSACILADQCVYIETMLPLISLIRQCICSHQPLFSIYGILMLHRNLCDENIHFDIPELEALASTPEDQATFNIAFSQLVDLCTIIEDVLSQIFSTNLIKKSRKDLVLTRLARLEDLNVRLFRWYSELPDIIAWNQWKPVMHSLSSRVMLAQ